MSGFWLFVAVIVVAWLILQAIYWGVIFLVVLLTGQRQDNPPIHLTDKDEVQ